MTSALPGLDVRFKVQGTPLPKGSMSGFPIDRGPCPECKGGKRCGKRNCFGGRVVGVSVTDQGDAALKAWQGQLHYAALSARNAARQRMIHPPAALAVTLVFVMPRPAGHRTANGDLSADGKTRPFPTTTPDFDKISRTVADAMTEALVLDDKQVVVARIAEVYADRKGWTGATIHARHMLSLDAWVEHELSYHGVWTPEPDRQGTLL